MYIFFINVSSPMPRDMRLLLEEGEKICLR